MSLDIAITRKRFANGHEALRDLHLHAQAGEFVALVGPSGAGKSTLLNLVAGLDTDFEGHLSWKQQPLSRNTLPRLGYLFQESRLLPWLTVRQNLRLVLPDLSEAALRLGLASVELTPGCADQYPGQLSGGMQRRVALLRAFVVQPELLLMDEPFQSLDAPTASQLRALLHRLWTQTRPTVLFVTHDLREALCLAQRIVFLSGAPAQVVCEHRPTQTALAHVDDAAVQHAYAELLRQNPQLLHGIQAPQ
ncbi:MAG: ABC transporter ATP-binding protein [Rhodoferax sp.]